MSDNGSLDRINFSVRLSDDESPGVCVQSIYSVRVSARVIVCATAFTSAPDSRLTSARRVGSSSKQT